MVGSDEEAPSLLPIEESVIAQDASESFQQNVGNTPGCVESDLQLMLEIPPVSSRCGK